MEDKFNKKNVSVLPLVHAAMNLNLNLEADCELDGDGLPVLPQRERGTIYHTQESWKDKGLLILARDGCLSITGGGQYYYYNDAKLWETAREISPIPRRSIPEMIRKIWDQVEEEYNGLPTKR